jgi:hypothetical protein
MLCETITLRVAFEFINYAHTVPVDLPISMGITRKKKHFKAVIILSSFIFGVSTGMYILSKRQLRKKVTHLLCILNVLYPRTHITVQRV